MAAHPAARLDLFPRRCLRLAAVGGEGAARMEVAPGRGRRRIGYLAGQRFPLLPQARVGLWDRREERRGIGVLWLREEGVAVGDLDHLADVHDRDAVADGLDDGEGVR